MSKILVIGAVGAMCIEATRDLIETGGNHEFMLADLNLEKLKSLQKEFSNHKISITKVDARNFDEMRKAVEGYDFVMNGLAFGNAEPSIRACMEAKYRRSCWMTFPETITMTVSKNPGFSVLRASA